MSDVNNLQKQIKQRNIFAVTFIGALVSVSYFLLVVLFQQQEKVAEIIDIAGSQRMYSQKIAMLAQHHVKELKLVGANEKSSQLLQATANVFQHNQQQLITLIKAKDRQFSFLSNGSLLALSHNLNEAVAEYANAALQLSKVKTQTNGAQFLNKNFNPEAVEKILLDLDDVVQVLEGELHKKLENLQIIGSLICVLISLVAIYWLLLKPMEERVIVNYEKLLNSQHLNEEFKFAINQHAIVFRLNMKGEITYINDRFSDFYQFQEEEIVNQSVFLICGRGYSQADFNAIFNVCVNEDYWRGETLNKIKGQRELWFDTTIVPLKNKAGKIISFIVMQNDINDIKQTEVALNQLHEITARVELSTDEKIQQLLQLGRQLYNLPLAIVSQVIGQEYKVLYCEVPNDEVKQGDVFELGNTYCCHTLASGKPLSFHHAGQSEISHHPCYKNFALESYVGVPFYVNGQLFGTLNFSGSETTPKAFTARELELVQLIANWLGSELTRKEQERVVLAQKSLVDQVGAQARIGAWEVDFVNNHVFWSKVVRDIHEVPEDYQPELATVIDFYPEGESRNKIEAAIAQSVTDGLPFAVEVPLISAKGSKIWVSARGVAESENGVCVRLAGSFQDITERVEAQQILNETKERLEFILQSTGVGIWDWDVASDTTILNERWADILGYTLDEIMPASEKTWLALIHPDDVHLSEQRYSAYCRNDDEFYMNELRMRHKEGHWIWVLDTGKAVEVDEAKMPKRMIGTMIDITHQKAAEEQILKNNQRMTLATDATGIGIWEYNLINDVLEWDDWVCKLYGVKPNEFDHQLKTWVTKVHPDDLREVNQTLDHAIKHGTKFEKQFKIIWPNG
ncbi:MAG: PAS domain-containing protein, partial [Thalassotalea sp.]